MMLRISVLVCSLTCLMNSAVIFAQDYPTRSIRLLVPWPPGGTVDILARPIGQQLSIRLGQSVVIDNRPGANSIVGSDIVAKSSPDGHTFLLDNVTGHSANITLYRKLPFNSLKDYAPIALIAATPNLIVVHPSTPVKTMKDLVASAKSQPGKLAYASFGTGSAAHLAGEMLKGLTGIDLVHVPYKGGAPALADVIAGRVFLMFASLPSVIGHVEGSRVRAIAIAGPKRSSVLPNVPSTAESGFSELDATTWYGAMFPVGTRKEIVNRMNLEIINVIRDPEMAKRLTSQGYELVGSTPGELAQHLQRETGRWGKVIKQAGIQLD
jgi:tripartite-type tricarboxylate transporter receptor subunit TctC